MLESMLTSENKRSTGPDPDLKVVSLLKASVNEPVDLINPGYAIRTLKKQTWQGKTWFDGVNESNQRPYFSDIPNLDATKNCMLELTWIYDTFSRPVRLIQFDFTNSGKSALLFNRYQLTCQQRNLNNVYYTIPTFREYGIYHTALQQIDGDVHLFIDGKPIHVFKGANIFMDGSSYFIQLGTGEGIYGLLYNNLRVYQGIKYPPGEEFEPQYDFTVENS
ncbi:hypothetical protein SPLA10_PHROGS00017 [Salmonella phage SPLA10]|nr:hypothetical protein SPLA10_PHROGS00017 [Salmonella phage SPLA10]